MNETFKADNIKEHEKKLQEFSKLIEKALEKSIIDAESFKNALLSGKKEQIDPVLAVIKISADELESIQFRRMTHLKIIAREYSVAVPTELSQVVKTVKALEEKNLFSLKIINQKEKDLILALAALTNLCRQMANDSIDTLSLTYKLLSKDENQGHSLYNNYGKVGKARDSAGILDTRG